MKLESLQQSVAHLEKERAGLEEKLRDVHQEMNQLRDQKRLLEGRLNGAETALTLQVRITDCNYFSVLLGQDERVRTFTRRL